MLGYLFESMSGMILGNPLGSLVGYLVGMSPVTLLVNWDDSFSRDISWVNLRHASWVAVCI